jgi:O-antigen/teichoic acid export membrane protein
MLKYASSGAAKQNWDELAGVYRLGMAIAIAASGLATIALVLVAPLIAEKLFEEPSLLGPIRIMALSIAPSSLLALHGEMLKALKLSGPASLLQGSLPPIVTFSVLGITVAFFGTGLTPSGIAWISVVSAIGMILFAVILWRRNAPETRGRRGSFDAARLLRTSIPLFWVTSMNLIMGATDTVMLGIWTTAEQVAQYGVAARLAVLVSFPLIAVNTIAAPKLAGLYATGDVPTVNRVARNAVIITVMISLPISIFYWLRPDLGLLLFGNEFLPAAGALMLLTAGHFVNAATGPVGNLLMLTGHEKMMRNNIAGCSLLNIVLNIILIPKFEIIGAAGATAFSLATMNIVSLLLVYRYLGIIPIPLAPTITRTRA